MVFPRKHFSIRVQPRAFRLRVCGCTLGCAMRRLCIGSLAAAGLLFTSGMALDYAKQFGATALPAGASVPVTQLRAARGSASDLAGGGELSALPPGAARHITREDSLHLTHGTPTLF